MKGEILLSIVINGRGKKPRKDGTVPLQIRAYCDKRKRFYASGLYILPTQWDKTTRLVCNHPLADEYNTELLTQKLTYQKHILDLKRKEKKPTLQQLDNMREYGTLESFVDFVAHELEHDVTITGGTRRNHMQTLNKLLIHCPDTKFADLNYLWVERWDTFLRNQGLAINSVHGHHKRTIRYINLAEKKELIPYGCNPYRHFKLKTEDTAVNVLSPYEIASIESLELSKQPHLERIRDLFLFCCFTGLRSSDAIKLRFCDLDRSPKGYSMNMMAQKTGKQLMLPLYEIYDGKPERLVLRHQVIKQVAPRSEQLIFVVPKKGKEGITNQYLNRILKVIAEKANIRKKLTSHIARHTFVTDMLDRGVPTHVVQKIVQHANIKTTMRYAHIKQVHVSNAIGRINW